MSRQHVIDVLNLAALALLAGGLWRTLFGPAVDETTWQALARQIRRPTSASAPQRTNEERAFAALPREEQDRFRRAQELRATQAPTNRGELMEATGTVMNEIRIGAVNAKWGALLLVLGGACSTIATFL